MNRVWRILLIASLLFVPWVFGTPATAQEETEPTTAERMLAELTVSEKVGQLFLVTFTGDSADVGSDIADLVLNYQIGGIAILAENDNITGYGNTATVPEQLLELTNQLQSLAIAGAPATPPNSDPAADTTSLPPTPTPAPPRAGLPLFIAINHEGNGYPFTEILSGVAEVPNNMTIGATWNPDYAEAVGQVVGRNLSALGINMLMGPALDVLEMPQPDSTADMGVRTFGGDPYWVGVLGRAYTEGIHSGGNGRVAVIAKHFPGNGSSDRPVVDEVPTVRKSLEQLKQIELAPFFAVTSGQYGEAGVVDGLLATHIRYQGFQGNIRATTVPVSFDPQALTNLMQLEEFAGWRAGGGLIVSDGLGVRSVEKFYDATVQEFPHRRVAKDAFLAGNDLLYLADFALGSSNYTAELANIKDTVVWFQEKYESDPSFQQRVDEAVLRILQAKLRLYEGDFSLDGVIQSASIPENALEPENAILQEVAQSAVTLISPSTAELVERLPSSPGPDDQIVIFTDERRGHQCSTCIPFSLIGASALEEKILALYGPAASGQVRNDQIRSFSFLDLAAYLATGAEPIPPPPPQTPVPAAGDNVPATIAPTPTPPPEFWVQEWVRDATWIIFAIQDNGANFPVLRQMLAQRTDLLRDRKVIVFAYDAPYFLDTTEISKLTAYYGLFNRTDAAIDASARALFQELPLSGALPVSVAGIGYDLFANTLPSPDQVIELFIVGEDGSVQAPFVEDPLDASVGDTLRLQTGIIRDHNGNPVPDGTLVQYTQQDRIQGLVNIIGSVPTVNGTAVLDFVLEARTGQFRITASAGEAIQSQEVDIVIENEAVVRIITPTPAPTATPTPTPTPTATPLPTATPTPLPTATAIPPAPLVPQAEGVLISISQLQMLASLIAGLVVVITFEIVLGGRFNPGIDRRLGRLLWSLAGGLILYNYFRLGLPGMTALVTLGGWAGLLTTLTGALAGFVAFQATNTVSKTS